MFDRFKKKPEPEETKVAKVTEEPKAEVTEKPEAAEKVQTSEKPSKKVKKTRKPAKGKPAKAAEDTGPISPQVHAALKEAEAPFVGIKEYSSAVEIAENIDREMAETKSALGEYLRQLDDKRGVAEKAKRLHDVVVKMANKKETKESSNQLEVNGLEIVLDATALNELTAIESVVKSYQQRLMALQQAREALKALDQVGDTEGIKYLALEREGIPEQILLKLS
jgi:hypothetical protein